VYWGAAEPLGQSLVLPSVRELATQADMTLITFEKEADLRRPEDLERIRGLLSSWSVRWICLRYHKRPKWPATLYDVLNGILSGLSEARVTRPDIVHGRTFIGGILGLAIAVVLRVRFLYHNEGFYPDEQVDGGVWREGSLPHRVARWIEEKLYSRAAGIAAMSFRARAQIEAMPAVQARGTPVIVVPSCVDLDLFRLGSTRNETPRDGPLRLVYVGSIGHRYIFDKVAAFVAVAAQKARGVHLRVLTPVDPSVVEAYLRAAGVPQGAWSIDRVPHARIPGELSAQHAGLFFLTRGISEHGCSPTKIGEYWAMGIPVITTPNVSDTDEIVRREGVGVVVGGHDPQQYEAALAQLETVLSQPGLARRCRLAAEGHYSLRAACDRQTTLYHQLAERE
jgi:glycosyltransferase involved in cell wall biosynthesis